MRNTIRDQLQKALSAQLEISDIEKGEGKIKLQYHINVKQTNISLLLALVEKNAVSKVLRGENEGRTLSHVQIVRSLQNIHLNGQSNGTGTLDIPEGLEKNSLEVIAFLQKDSNGEIIASN